MRAGNWTGSAGATEFTIGDLEDMVRSFTGLGAKTGFRPHLKLGHGDAQAFFGQDTGFPSLGEVVNVYRDGDTVYADIENIPDALVDLIATKRYSQLSIELYPKYTHDGVEYKNVLVGVALLGAELPAVKGLKDLREALFKEQPALFAEAQGKQELTAMTTPAQGAETVSKAEFEAMQARVTAAEAAVTAANQREVALAARNRTTAITTAVDAALAAGKVGPKLREQAIALGEGFAVTTKIKFGEGADAKEHEGVAAFAAFLEALPVAVDLSERGTTDVNKDKPGAGGDAGKQVNDLAEKMVKEGKAKTYAEAFRAVLADPANKALKEKYTLGE